MSRATDASGEMRKGTNKIQEMQAEVTYRKCTGRSQGPARWEQPQESKAGCERWHGWGRLQRPQRAAHRGCANEAPPVSLPCRWQRVPYQGCTAGQTCGGQTSERVCEQAGARCLVLAPLLKEPRRACRSDAQQSCPVSLCCQPAGATLTCACTISAEGLDTAAGQGWSAWRHGLQGTASAEVHTGGGREASAGGYPPSAHASRIS